MFGDALNEGWWGAQTREDVRDGLPRLVDPCRTGVERDVLGVVRQTGQPVARDPIAPADIENPTAVALDQGRQGIEVGLIRKNRVLTVDDQLIVGTGHLLLAFVPPVGGAGFLEEGNHLVVSLVESRVTRETSDRGVREIEVTTAGGAGEDRRQPVWDGRIGGVQQEAMIPPA
jgi:hypothetical protein